MLKTVRSLGHGPIQHVQLSIIKTQAYCTNGLGCQSKEWIQRVVEVYIVNLYSTVEFEISFNSTLLQFDSRALI